MCSNRLYGIGVTVGMVAAAAILCAPRGLIASPTGADDSEVEPDCPAERAEHPVEIEIRAYGEAVYEYFDYGPDQRSGERGSPADHRAVTDVPRFVFELELEFSSDLELEAELEYEHLGAGTAIELEYEEFGEYEREVETAGDVELEQLHLTWKLRPELTLGVGRFLVPVGLSNAETSPLSYLGARRSEAESALLPVSWFETGLQLFGGTGVLRYRGQLVNGLDSSGFSSQRWIAQGHQRRFEQVRATSLAGVLAIDVVPISGCELGIAGYHGDSNANRPKPDLEGVSGSVSLIEAHGRFERGRWLARALVLRGFVENADLITAKNGRLSQNLGVLRSPVAKEAGLWLVEAGYDVWPWIQVDHEFRLIPFLRVERYDTMAAVDPGIFDDPRFERTVTTAGLDFFLRRNVVFKTDYSVRSLGADRFRDEKTFRCGFAFDTH
ncbi:MAG: hypothetical protein R3E12_09680 [Candidatus Eisenbacteria bacterium]